MFLVLEHGRRCAGLHAAGEIAVHAPIRFDAQDRLGRKPQLRRPSHPFQAFRQQAFRPRVIAVQADRPRHDRPCQQRPRIAGFRRVGEADPMAVAGDDEPVHAVEQAIHVRAEVPPCMPVVGEHVADLPFRIRSGHVPHDHAGRQQARQADRVHGALRETVPVVDSRQHGPVRAEPDDDDPPRRMPQRDRGAAGLRSGAFQIACHLRIRIRADGLAARPDRVRGLDGQSSAVRVLGERIVQVAAQSAADGDHVILRADDGHLQPAIRIQREMILQQGGDACGHDGLLACGEILYGIPHASPSLSNITYRRGSDHPRFSAPKSAHCPPDVRPHGISASR